MSTSSPPPSPRRSRNSQIFLAALLIAGFILVCLFGLRVMHAMRILRQMRFQSTAAPGVVMVRGWMTIEYISQVYRIPEDDLLKQLNIPDDPANAHRSLSELNRLYYPKQRGLLVNRVQEILESYHLSTATPPPPPTAPKPPLPTQSSVPTQP